MLSWIPFLVLGLIVVAGLIWCWWFVPYYQLNYQLNSRLRRLYGTLDLTAKDSAELEDQYRKTLTQTLVGAVVLLTVIVAFQQLFQTRKNSDITHQNQLLAKGFELLGQSSSAERLGGIRILRYWVERPSQDPAFPPENRYEIFIPTLISFVRDKTELKVDTEVCEKFTRPDSAMVEYDVQAALHLLRERSTTHPQDLQFRARNLSRAKLPGTKINGSDFAFADLSEADLSHTILRESKFYCANLYQAKFIGADLSDVSLQEACLYQTKFRDVRVNEKTDLEKACIDDATKIANPELETAMNYRTMRALKDPGCSCNLNPNLATQISSPRQNYPELNAE